CPYQPDGGGEAPAKDVDRRAFGVIGGGLRRDDIQVADDARLVLVGRQLERAARRLHDLVLQRRFLLEDAERREVVLDVLERGEDGLAVGRDLRVVGRDRLLADRAARAGVEE